MNINLYDYRINIRTAGPSVQDNLRSELYFAGCRKAEEGDPCRGCFNYQLWQREQGSQISIQAIVDRLEDMCSVKSVTIVGGEPTDQLESLIELCRLLKKYNYHVLVISWHTYEDMLKENPEQYEQLFDTIDVLVDGQYDEHQRIYDDTHTNVMRSFIGSNNQKVVDLSQYSLDNKVIKAYNYIDQYKDMKIKKDGGVEFWK
jgi:hypothetical protein CLOSPO_00866|nr:MAG TPA: 4Fe-4S single cluster domain protein [Caudoviricetes sp.]